ncbi:MAG: nucleotidyl transferase AbiEii/AbiGii toxin family protein, partial [bacterium]
MITKQEILERAREWNLRPEVVEKDYVLGWLLAAASQHAVIRSQWVLKGGTCVKKCFFETYRFSEDLDFSLMPSAPYDHESIILVLQELADAAAALSGIRFSRDQFTVKQRQDKLARVTFEGRLGYQGPLAIPGWPRILFDITRHENITLPPA